MSFRLHRQVLLPIVLALTTLLFLGLYILSRYLSGTMNDLYQQRLLDESALLELSLQPAFIQRDLPLVEEIFVNTSVQSETRVIRLITSENQVLLSSAPDEAGVTLNIGQDLCVDCHQEQSGPSPTFLRRQFQDQDVVITANRVENAVSCRPCHSEDGDGLGVLLTEHDPGPMDAWITQLGAGLFAGGGALLAAFVLFSAVVLQKNLLGPLFLMERGEKLEHLSQRVDLLGRIATRIQQAQDRAGVLEEQTAFRRRSFDALLSLFETLDTDLSVPEVMQHSLKTIQAVTGFSSVAMRLYDEKQGCFRLVAQEGMSPGMVQALHCIPDNRGFQAEVKVTRRPVCSSDLANDPRLGSPSALEEGYQSLASVPFLCADVLVGSMELASKERHSWTEDEQRWLALAGRSVGIRIHHAHLTEQLKGMLVLDERNRVAQEIHDGLAQLLGSLRLWAEEARLSAEAQEYPQVVSAVEKIERTARDAYASLREEIMGLRNTIVPGQDLKPIFTEYLNRFQRQWGIQTRIEFQRDGAQGERYHYEELSPAAEIQLLRILQEGLTNVRRHAGARSVLVRVEDGNDQYRVRIQDDGRGFDLQQVSSDQLGLRIIKERAASVGGQVVVSSSPGKGTTLEIRLPKAGNVL